MEADRIMKLFVVFVININACYVLLFLSVFLFMFVFGSPSLLTTLYVKFNMQLS